MVVPHSLYAQAMGMGSKEPANATNPTTLPPVIQPRQPPHDGWSGAAGGGGNGRFARPRPSASPTPEDGKQILRAEASEKPSKPWWQYWHFTLSALYQFSNQRSRVNDLSWNSNSAGIDLTAALESRPYTSLDFSYFYSHFTGSSAGGANDVTNQHVGAIRILQPLNPIWCDSWRPADQSASRVNQQWATLFRVAYGGSLGSLAVPNFAFQHDTAHTFVGDALLDYQIAWFPDRLDSWNSSVSENRPRDFGKLAYRYPNLFCELSSGMQFSTLQFDASTSRSNTTTSGTQLDYLNTITLSYSFRCRWGVLVAIGWDAPVDSQPVRGARPYHANTATFSGGLVYNFFPYNYFPESSNLLDRVSMNLLYSYTAFDPLSETNTLQFQISYSF